MRLYFFRHGPAMSRDEWDGPDDRRPLTADGIEATRRMSRRIADMGLAPDAILASPYARAWSTGEILVDTLGTPDLLHEESGLEPGRFTPVALEEMLEPHPDAAHLVLIGHEPSMTAVISGLIGGGELALKKAGLARVDLYPGSVHGVLRWLIQPKMR